MGLSTHIQGAILYEASGSGTDNRKWKCFLRPVGKDRPLPGSLLLKPPEEYP